MATYVIVHGAWGGAWAWNKIVVPMLRAAGHEVHAVTLTGLGERQHLATPDTDLTTHIQDVVNVLFYEDLRDVILAGHSYGGMVITGVADRMPERIAHLVYMDALTPHDGDSLVDRLPGRIAHLAAQAQDSGDGWRIPPGPIPSDQPIEVTEWATPRRVAQPLKTFTQKIALEHGETTLPRTFVYCTVDKEPDSPQAQRAAEIAADPSWQYISLETGHNLHYSAPQETVDILLSVADR